MNSRGLQLNTEEVEDDPYEGIPSPPDISICIYVCVCVYMHNTREYNPCYIQIP